MVVLSPVLWLGELVGGMFATDEENANTDFAKAIDMWQSANHISFETADLLVCTMEEENQDNPMLCVNIFDNNGQVKSDFESDVDISEIYSIYKDATINEKKG